MTRTEAIARFLRKKNYPLCPMYNADMEVQVNVIKGDGELITGHYKGRNWQGFTDGMTTWKSFRIPWNARDKPYYEDKDITFDISKHAEAIGMTGWDWKNKCSRWVAFDFDSIVDHKQGLTNEELEKILGKLSGVQYISIYSSTSGNGYHIYVFCTVQGVANHTEHAAVARCLLAKISTEIGFNLEAKVDACGGNVWVWHREAKGFKLVKEGGSLPYVPDNWKSYLDRVSKYQLIQPVATDKDLLITAQNEIILDEDHLRLLEWFEGDSGLAWYDNDKQMLVCHTADLKRAHKELQLKGIFETIATGKDHGRDQNCFCFPLSSGSWIIRRHTRGCQEFSSWTSDSSRWTTCYYNRLPNLRTASQAMEGVEGEKDYRYKHLREAIETLKLMDITCPIPEGCIFRPASIKQVSDKIIISFKAEDGDIVDGWARKKNDWERIFFSQHTTPIQLPDNLVRHIVMTGINLGWFLFTNNKWVLENKHNIISALLAIGHNNKQVDILLGTCILENWLQVNLPFKPEYPGKRRWNRNAAQFRFNPKRGKHPTWDLILEHCGKHLKPDENEWCKEHGIITGYLYLQLWIACLFQFPNEPLPYLVFYGNQNTGKSIFHESISLLFKGGYIRADHALTNPSGFNGELLNAILCVVEETNLSKRGHANDRIKDWVTGIEISIHAKGSTPFNIPNTTHWVQCTNDPAYCPILPGDTRIVLTYMDAIQTEIPKSRLMETCNQEAPAFLYTLIERDLPETKSRLRLPVLESEIKSRQQELNKDIVTEFVEEKCHQIDGSKILFSQFYDEFIKWLDPIEKLNWTKRRLSTQLMSNAVIKGRWGGDGSLYIGNFSWLPEVAGVKLKVEKGRLIDG